MKLQCLTLLILISVLAAVPAPAVDVADTRLLAQPSCSSEQVVFLYAGDVWIASLDGGRARRLTSHPGEETLPCLSPDGSLVAFSGEYDGNVDVFVVPVTGGMPQRLTWHPGEDHVRGWTPDGAGVLFSSSREAAIAYRHEQLFTVDVQSGALTKLPLPYGRAASYSPDGRFLAYNPLADAFREWKGYRGGTTSRIWICDLQSYEVREIPQPAGRCNDSEPIWQGERIYFLSDRDGEFNVYAYAPAENTVERLTGHEDFPVLHLGGGGGQLVYEQAGWLHRLDPTTGRSERLVIGAAADLLEARPRYVEGADDLRGFTVSPTGARAAFDCRGEIVTVPAEKGSPRNLTNTPGVHENSPAWSPDGRWVAYFSDASGEYALHLAPQDGRGVVRVFALAGAGFYEDIRWAPDSQKLSYTDNSRSLYWLDLAKGTPHKISQETVYGPVNTLHHAWSPDSRWIVYTRNTPTYFQEVYLYSLADGASHLITDGLSDVAEPVFDASGKYLWMLASTDAGPVRSWFAMSNADMEMTYALYLAVLAADVPSPLAAESDEEPLAGDADEGEKSQDKNEKERKQPPPVDVDFAGLGQRVLALLVPAAGIADLQAGEPGRVYYRRGARIPARQGPESPVSLCRFDLAERKEEVLDESVDAYAVSADGKKLLIRSGESWRIVDVDKVDQDQNNLPTDEIRLRIDPRREWSQIYDEAWRINRDFFYDPGMHGADWPAMKAKYAVFLPHLATRGDLNRVLQWLGSEVRVGHHRVGGGDRLYEPEEIPGGLLGADFTVEHGRYRFSKIFGGLNWNPELRAPLTEPGVDVHVGDYLMAVDGVELKAPDNLYRLFENTADRIVVLAVSRSPDGKNARTVQVVPIASEEALRHRDWVEGNIQKVHEATGGRVAYVHLPNTTTLGHTYFKRYFFPQADKEAIIVDERYNRGGQVADYYVDILARQPLCRWAMRYGQDLRTPLSAIPGPKVMLADETSGSGGDLLPWMFRKMKLGTLVGKRTWGGLVGILGFPILLDGGHVTAPNLAIWTADEGWVVENEGVPPDVEVEQWPAAVIAGHDPQLEKAIEIVLQQLAENPPREPRRPPYPVKTPR